jgi:hypothetical protein
MSTTTTLVADEPEVAVEIAELPPAESRSDLSPFALKMAVLTLGTAALFLALVAVTVFAEFIIF